MEERYIVLYDFEPTTDNGVKLKQGEIISIREKGTNGWWNGDSLAGNGWFPMSYVQKYEVLPPGWQALTDDQGRTYYFNQQTNSTSWTLPTSSSSSSPSPSAPPSSSNDPSSLSPPAQISKSTSNHNLNDQPPENLVEMEGKTFAKDPSGRITYSGNFWSDTPTGSGFDVLVQKHRNGKEVIKDIAEWVKERAAVEEKYSKELLKVAKSPLGDQEDGTMKTAWYQVKFDIENQSRIRAKMAQSLRDKVEKPLMEFKDNQKKKRKDFEVVIARDRKAMAVKEQDVLKAKKLYETAMREAENSEAIVQKGPTDQNKGQFSKLEDKAKADRKKAVQTGIDYKKIVDEYEKIRQQWEDSMCLSCLDFMEAEEERVAFLKTTLEGYLDVEQQTRDAMAQSGDMVRNSVQAVNSEVDIEMFVKAKGTGTRKPPPVVFEQYKK